MGGRPGVRRIHVRLTLAVGALSCRLHLSLVGAASLVGDSPMGYDPSAMKKPILNRNDLFLAPMAEISHAGFRRLVADFGGCDWYCTEMLSAAAVTNASPYSRWYLDFNHLPERTIVQIAGTEPEVLARAAERLREFPIAGIDINMGCSVPNIRKKGWGVELMKDPVCAARIVSEVRSAAGERLVSAKLRIGHSKDPHMMIDFCQQIAEAGADFITLNPRTATANRDRPGDWEYVKILRDALSIPVVGNGEIRDQISYARRKKISGEGPVMIGRGAVRRPWIFYAQKRAEGSTPPLNPLLSRKNSIDLRATAEQFFIYLRNYQPEDFQVSRARRFFYYFCENFKFGTHLKMRIQNLSRTEAIQSEVFSYLERNPDETVVSPGN